MTTAVLDTTPEVRPTTKGDAKRAAMAAELRSAMVERHVRVTYAGDTTLAWLVDVANVVYVAAAIRNPVDLPDPLVGAREAVARLLSGEACVVRVPSKRNIARHLRKMWSLGR